MLKPYYNKGLFLFWCQKVLPLVYDDSLSYYEVLCKVVHYLNNVIRNVETAEENIQTVYDELLKLKEEFEEFKDDFDADVEKILDDKIQELIDAGLILPDGSVTREKLANNISDYFDIDYHTSKYVKNGNSTDVVYAIIPKEYKPKLYLANETIDTVEECVNASFANKATVQINGGRFNTQTGETYGSVIYNGNIAKLQPINPESHAYPNFLCMTPDGLLHSRSSNLSQTELEAIGAEWGINVLENIVINGVYVSTQTQETDDYHPRSFIGQDAAGNYIIGSCSGGKQADSYGMNIYDIHRFVSVDVGFIPFILMNLDGGMSSNFVYKQVRMNKVYDGNNRKVANFIYWAKEDTKLLDEFSKYLIEKQVLNILEKLGAEFDPLAKIRKTIRPAREYGIDDLDDIDETSVYLVSANNIHNPLNDYGICFTFKAYGTAKMQFIFNNRSFFFRNHYETWSDFRIIPYPSNVIQTVGEFTTVNGDTNDLNNIRSNAVLYASNTSANRPDNKTGLLFSYNVGSSTNQFFLASDNTLYARGVEDTYQQSWQKIIYAENVVITKTDKLNGDLYCFVKNGIAFISGDVSTNAIDANDVLATGLPVPVTTIFPLTGLLISSTDYVRLRVSTTGELIAVSNYASGKYARIMITYPVA